MELKDFTEANRQAWDEAAPLHRNHNMENLLAAVKEPGYSCLDDIETAILNTLGIKGISVAQLCCNNGPEILSVKNLGAARCVGFDGSEGFIAQARELAEAGGIECTFVCTDIYDIGEDYAGSFDLVTVTIGVLSWMPDLDRFFSIAAGLLKPGGAMFIYEQHPILEMIEPGDAGDPVEIGHSYFKKEPFIDTDGLDYYGGSTYESKPLYSFIHKFSDIIMAGIHSKLTVEHMEELPGHISNTWYNVENHEPQFPMSYTMVLRKTE
ncbi:MAG: class I SAM-dependent methyltransferase [Hyphomicrobiales bacterium]